MTITEREEINQNTASPMDDDEMIWVSQEAGKVYL